MSSAFLWENVTRSSQKVQRKAIRHIPGGRKELYTEKADFMRNFREYAAESRIGRAFDIYRLGVYYVCILI